MSAKDCFTENMLQTCAEGRLGRARETEVRVHCGACPDCRQVLQDYERLNEILADDTVEPTSSVWPAVEARLRDRTSPWAKVAVSLGSAAAVAAGLFIGFHLVPWQGGPPAAVWEQDTWSEMGSLLADPSIYGNLDTIYWDLASDEGEASR